MSNICQRIIDGQECARERKAKLLKALIDHLSSELTTSEFIVMAQFFSLTVLEQKEWAAISFAQLASRCGQSKNCCMKAVKGLILRGYVETKLGRPAEYRLTKDLLKSVMGV